MSSDERPARAKDDSRFRTIFDSEPECVKLIGSDCTLIDMNPAGLRMIGAESIELVRGQSLFGLIDPAYHQLFRETVDAVFRGESRQAQFEIVGLNGRRLCMDQSAAPLFDPTDPTRVVEMVAVTRDITAQREAEGELAKAKLAEELNRSKSEFLSNVGHELMTPLNHIIGYAELLQESALDQARHADAADVQQILHAAGRLLSMVNQMLSISLVDVREQKVFVDECDINVIIHDAVEAMKPAADANSNEIAIEAHEEVGHWICDATKIDQCLRGLLSNAVRFTNAGVITVRARRAVANGRSWLDLDVIDNGPGIDPLRLETLFEPFSAIQSMDRKRREGMGLGLAFTRQLARLMGGDVTATSTVGAGSHFSLSVPAEFHAAAPAQPSPARAQSM
jgi:PAS domain S-box-containing protein